ENEITLPLPMDRRPGTRYSKSAPAMGNFRLKVFRTVADESSNRRAAERLHLSQAAVSQQVQALEGELGIALFDRGKGRVRLTEGGAALLPYAHKGARLAEEALPGRCGQRHRAAASYGVRAARLGLGVTLFLIGTGISRDTLRKVGTWPLLQGILLWIVVGTASSMLILKGWIHL
ncbi:MAG: LysR family transcriptional regulator, partial [Acidobacteriaceae bacterium]